MAGYLFSAVGVLYAVLLGFVVVVVWEKYDATIANVQDEVDAAGDLYHVVDGFPDTLRTRIRTDLTKYAQTVIRVEWPAMASNQDGPETGSKLIEDAAYTVNTFSPHDQRGYNAQQAAIGNEQRLFDARRQRLVRAQPAVPGVLWFALVAGALAMVAFCYIFGVENRPAQLLMTANPRRPYRNTLRRHRRVRRTLLRLGHDLVGGLELPRGTPALHPIS